MVPECALHLLGSVACSESLHSASNQGEDQVPVWQGKGKNATVHSSRREPYIFLMRRLQPHLPAVLFTSLPRSCNKGCLLMVGGAYVLIHCDYVFICYRLISAHDCNKCSCGVADHSLVTQAYVTSLACTYQAPLMGWKALTGRVLSQVLPQAYGGVAPMIPIERAVHARLVREGLERARSSPESEAAVHAPDAEGRLTRAGRCTCNPQCLHLLCFTPATLALYLPTMTLKTKSAWKAQTGIART